MPTFEKADDFIRRLSRSDRVFQLCQNPVKGEGVTLRHMVVGMGLLGVALHSAALTLGTTTAVPLIGRPLNITIPVATDGASDLCLQAEVLYADSPIAPALVTTRFEPAPGAKQGLIRLRSSKAVDEPVVTVEVAAGCIQRVSRRYVLLADVGDEVALPSFASMDAAPVANDLASPEVLPAPRGMRGMPVPESRPGKASAKAAGGAATPNAQTTQRRSAPSGGATARKASKPTHPAKQGDRLKLVPADFAFERNPALKLSLELKGVPAGGVAERAAAAALWRVLNLDVDASLRGLEKITAMEAELRTLRATKAQDERSVAALKAELAQAQSERYANLLVYGLAGLALVLAALLAWRWRRTRHQPVPAAWAASHVAPLGNPAAESSYLPAAEPEPARERANTATGIDLDMVASMFPEPDGGAAVPGTAPTDFGDSMTPSPRGVKAEELLDMQQQADFFVSLGQHDQAITVLRSYIGQAGGGTDAADTSPLAYLDLFRLYHLLNRRHDYQLLRDDFSQAFHVSVPEFDDYRHQSLGLQAYPETLSRIVVAWPRPAVLPLIEGLIFKRPDGSTEVFDLEACRDLLLLYAVAKERLADEGTALTF